MIWAKEHGKPIDLWALGYVATPVRSLVPATHISPINTRVITHELLEGHLPFRENGEYSIVKAARCKLELPYPYWEVISGEG